MSDQNDKQPADEKDASVITGSAPVAQGLKKTLDIFWNTLSCRESDHKIDITLINMTLPPGASHLYTVQRLQNLPSSTSTAHQLMYILFR